MQRPFVRAAAAVTLSAALIFTVACGFQHSASPTSPTSPTPASSNNQTTPVTPSLIGVWTSNSLTGLPSPNTCGNFQFQVTSQDKTNASGNFSAVCAAGVTIFGTVSGQLNGSAVPLTVTGTANLPNGSTCNFTLTGTGSLQDGGNTLVVPYTGTTCLGPVHGTETLRKPTPASPAPSPAPSPSPTPAPAPTPTPTPAPSQPGGFNLSAVTIMGSPDVRGWPVTSQITSLVFSPGNLHVDHTKRGQWPPVVIAPDGTTQESTIWVFFHINGVWYGTGGERLRPGQADKGLGGPSDIGPGWLYDPGRWGPMAGYVPQVGEIVGFMVVAGSTRSDSNAPVQERSSVVLIPFPADGTTAGFPPFAGQDNTVLSVATSLRAPQPSSRRR